MTCYALACRQPEPCATQDRCESVWHLCELPPPNGIHYRCGVCGAHWTWRLGDTHGAWWRTPIEKPIGA